MYSALGYPSTLLMLNCSQSRRWRGQHLSKRTEGGTLSSLCSVITCLGHYCLETATMFPEGMSRLCKHSDDSHHRGNVS
jgi:hypothetical protein